MPRLPRQKITIFGRVRQLDANADLFVHRLQPRAQIDVLSQTAALPQPAHVVGLELEPAGQMFGNIDVITKIACQHLAQAHGAAHPAAKDRNQGQAGDVGETVMVLKRR